MKQIKQRKRYETALTVTTCNLRIGKNTKDKCVHIA